MFAERFALLCAEAGDPPLGRVAAAVGRAAPTDEWGLPVRVTVAGVSDWRRGRRVPARFAELDPVLTVLIEQASQARPHPCADGLYDADTWRRCWEEAAASPAVESGGAGTCPYQGLAAFSEYDANLFFGRERSVTALLTRLRGALDGGGVVMLVGASGAGKSSLINAGLVPALARGALTKGSENWPVVIMTPGMDPLDELGSHVPELAEILDKARSARLTKDQVDPEIADGAIAASRLQSRVRTACAAHVEREAGDSARLVIVVDQFEEAFTLCGSEEQRLLFVETLDAVSTPESPGGTAPAMVAVGVRVDFYRRCLNYPELAAALQERQMVLGPMTAIELRAAVTSPGRQSACAWKPVWWS
jgi:hypothetical protein